MKTFWSAIVDGTTHTFDVRGRMTRAHFWLFFLFLTLVSFVVNIILFLIEPTMPFSTLFFGGLSPAAVVVSALLLIPTTTAIVRRLHDGRFSSWHVFWYLVPNIMSYVIFFIDQSNTDAASLLALAFASSVMILLYLVGYLILLVLLTLPARSQKTVPVIPQT